MNMNNFCKELVSINAPPLYYSLLLIIQHSAVQGCDATEA